MQVETKVPATVANLGPGFDCLGIAVGMHLRVRFSDAEHSSVVGKGRMRNVATSLIYRSFVSAYACAGSPAPQVCIEVCDDYPSARGLGASASAIVAGLMGADCLGGLGLSQEQVCREAVAIEGHSDNVLPAILGGLVLSVGGGVARFMPNSQISPLSLVAREGFRTEAARRVVPDAVPRADAVANAAATALLVAVLTGRASPAELMRATEDRLHEPYRLPLMTQSQELHTRMRAKGIATALSGAGPSLICLVETARLEECASVAQDLAPDGWQVLTPGWDVKGALVNPVD